MDMIPLVEPRQKTSLVEQKLKKSKLICGKTHYFILLLLIEEGS